MLSFLSHFLHLLLHPRIFPHNQDFASEDLPDGEKDVYEKDHNEKQG